MAAHDEEERLLHSVALQNARSILLARQRAEEELVRAKMELEARTTELTDSLEQTRDARLEAETLLGLAHTLSAGLDLNEVVQRATDAGTQLSGAKFGAFFYNVTDEHGGKYLLFTLSGAPREAFEGFGMPRSTALFGPTFRGEGVVRIHDVLQDPRYGLSAPYHGMPAGHLPVRSYLATPVISRSGEIIGGLFFGHPDPGIFGDKAERLVSGIAAQAAVAIDNARLYRSAQQEIDERRKAEDSERRARTDAERATRLRDEFLATVSHELRTPLNGILGWSQILRMAPNDEAARLKAAEAIDRGCRAQVRLIDDLLDMSRIISGKLRLDVQTVELVPVIHAALETVQPAAEAKGIRIERVLDPHAGPVKGDPARLQQILWNLLSNAVKFTPKGGKVQVHLERVNSHLEISISDTGQGIVPDFLPFVFDRFRQADSSTTRHHGGLGLGLAVVKHLAELHGGKVWAKSPGEGQGATFTLHLPLAIVLHDSVSREHPSAPSTFGEYAGLCPGDQLENVRILVVDDDPDSVEILARVLRECKALVQTVTSAREALQVFHRWNPDFLVSDIGMPEMDGYELIKEVRSRGARTPAIAVTAFARPEDRIRVLQAGYNMHISKPLDPRELLAVMSSLLTAK